MEGSRGDGGESLLVIKNQRTSSLLTASLDKVQRYNDFKDLGKLFSIHTNA